MLRVKLPGGEPDAGASCARSARSRTASAAATASSSTRQNIQLHWLELGAAARGLRAPRRGGHDDRRRLRRHRPQHHRLPGRGPRRATSCSTAQPVVDEAADVLLRQPRLLEPAAQAQDHDRRLRRPLQRARDQLHRAGRRDRTRAARASPCASAAGSRRCRASRATSASSCPKEEAIEVLRRDRSTSGRRTSSYRVSRVKARLKFMVDDIGAGGHARAGRGAARPRARGLRAAAARRRAVDHIGVHPQKQAGPLLRRRPGPPRPRHRRPDDRRSPTSPSASAATSASPASRTSSSPTSPSARVDEVVARARARSASRSTSTALRGDSIACTGEPHCNFSVAETKTRLGRLIEHLEARFGDEVAEPAPAPRRLPARLRPALGRRHRLPGHDRARRAAASGGRPTTSSCAAASAPSAQIGRPLFRRVPTEELDAAVEGLVARLARRARATGETLRGVLAPADRRRARRRSAGREPAKATRREEEAAA